MTIQLSKDLEDRLKKHVDQGPFETVEDVVSAAVAMLDNEMRESMVKWLREEIDRGLNSGEPVPFDGMDAIIAEARAA